MEFSNACLDIERSGCNVVIGNYEVIRFIEHGNRCRPAMDCVQGELLIYRIKRCPEIEKSVLFAWMRQLVIQIEQYHRCRNNKCYKYINPYSVLVTRDDQILLLDLEAESNAFVMKSMQKRAMRNHFVKPIVHIRENNRISLDLYGYSKTIQFLLASTYVTPALTGWEKRRLSKIIEKCLNENSKKQYEDMKQVEKELPYVKEVKEQKNRKGHITSIAILFLGFLLFVLLSAKTGHYFQKKEPPFLSVNEENVEQEGWEEELFQEKME